MTGRVEVEIVGKGDYGVILRWHLWVGDEKVFVYEAHEVGVGYSLNISNPIEVLVSNI